MRRTTTLILALAMLLGACSGVEGIGARRVGTGNGGAGVTGPGGPQGGIGAGVGVGAGLVALQRFDTCDSFLRWVRAAAAEKVGPYGLDPNGGFGDLAVDMAVPMSAAGDDAGSGEFLTSAPPQDFSTTNVQELGIDEPDLVKTDGTRLYVLSAGTLYSIDVTDPATPTVLDRLRVAPDDAGISELLLGPDRIYAIGTVWGPAEFDDADEGERLFRPDPGRSEAVVIEIAVSADGGLSESSRLAVEGWYVAARRIGDGVRLVVRHDTGGRLGFLHPGHHGSEEDATAYNRDVILKSEVEDWIAPFRLVTADGDETSGLLTDCSRMTAPAEFSGAGSVSVLTLDMTRPLGDGNAVTLLGAGETVYASATSLYAATYAYPPIVFDAAGDSESDPAPDFATQIHQFDISDATGATYVASGEVPGRLLSQWAMSEHDGHLRVAVTEGSPWWCCSPGPSTSSVIVLRRDGRNLVEVGSVGDLGVGEDIVGVRFAGDRGYVVTFLFTDPLYVIDLSDPSAPAMAGELKITGYSAYLHPVGEGLLLGVGQEATPDGTTVGTMVSLFDVSDPARPAEVDRWVLEDSSSSVEWDHRAFLHWAPESLAVVPFDWAPGGAGAVALRIGDGDLEEVATIVQDGGPSGGGWTQRVARSVVVGDVLWTVGDFVVQANDLGTLDKLGAIVL